MKSLDVKKICALLTFLLFASGCSQNNLFALEVGQCFTNSGIGEEVSNVDLVDCDEPQKLIYDILQENINKNKLENEIGRAHV